MMKPTPTSDIKHHWRQLKNLLCRHFPLRLSPVRLHRWCNQVTKEIWAIDAALKQKDVA